MHIFFSVECCRVCLRANTRCDESVYSILHKRVRCGRLKQQQRNILSDDPMRKIFHGICDIKCFLFSFFGNQSGTRIINHRFSTSHYFTLICPIPMCDRTENVNELGYRFFLNYASLILYLYTYL